MDKVKKVLSSINKIAKEDKTLSRLVSQLDIPYGETAGNVISALGYGRKKRATKKTGGAKKKKTGGAKKRAPRKRGMGAPVAANARFFSATGEEVPRFPNLYPVAPAVSMQYPINPAENASSIGSDVGSYVGKSSSTPSVSSRSSTRSSKSGKGFGGFLQKLIQAPLAGLAATSGGLHGAVGSFGKKRGGRKMLPQVMPPMYM